MLEELKKSIDKGIDYAFMTGDKIAQSAKEMAKENKLTKEDAKKLYDHLMKKSVETRKNFETEMQIIVKNTLKKINIPTQDDIKKMEERIKKLESLQKTPAKPKSTVQGIVKTKPVVVKKK
ncbi:MAG: hypothetical protein PHF97_02050 [Bacteroidales bacterium]|nr:hypothetical protein [Bacteroidales bacterium]MDD4602574.1 hypothetical protein [Bacteroidales bacterium]